MRYNKFVCLLMLFGLASCGILFAQEESNMDFGLDIGIGAETFNEIDETEPITYQSLSLNPDFAIGPFGVGMDITVHYRFNGGETGNEFEIRVEDWIPTAGVTTVLDLYLPLLRYVRWGLRGEPLYIKLGSIEDATLGNGFIMGNYSNTLFMPELRIFALAFDLDGRLFKFPYVGMQSFVANLARWDVIGGRIFVRPLAWLDVPVIKHLEFGYTIVGDRNPYLHLEDKDWDEDGVDDTGSALVWGVDFKQPILSSPIFSISLFGDIVKQNENLGGMVGFGGRFFSILPYGFQARFLGSNFIPTYFGPTYDIYRPIYHAIASSTVELIPSTVGWFGTTGFAILDNQIVFNVSIDGPFEQPVPEEPDNWVNYPHLRGTLLVAKGLLPGFDFAAWYDKKNIQTFADLIDPTNAVIGAAINYQTGPAVITLEYDLKYNPEAAATEDQWETSAKLKSSISLF